MSEIAKDSKVPGFRADDLQTVSNTVFGLPRVSSRRRPRVGDGLPTIQAQLDSLTLRLPDSRGKSELAANASWWTEQERTYCGLFLVAYEREHGSLRVLAIDDPASAGDLPRAVQ